MRRIGPILGIALVLAPAVSAQLRNPFADSRYINSEQVFDTSALARLDLTMTESDYQSLLDDPEERVEVPADMRFRNALLDETVFNIGARFRGGTSLGLRKHSWNLDFDEFVEGQRLHGVRQFNIVSHHNDPSIFRGHLFHDFCRRVGIPDARSALCDLYLHTTGPGAVAERFLGTFVNVEQIDGTLLRAWFTTNDGPLYKCVYPADFRVIDDGSSEEYVGSQYELADDDLGLAYTPLAEFISNLNSISSAQLEAQLPQLLDVETYLHVLAAEVAFGHWDGHWANTNNCYLYYIPDNGSPGTGLMQFLSYDADNVMEVNFLGTDTATVAPLNFAPRNSSRPLPTRVLSVTAWRNRFLQILGEWYRDEFTPLMMNSDIARYRDMISPSIQADIAGDNYYGDQWGFDHQDFIDSVNGTDDVRDFVRRGVFEYVRVRSGYATPQGLIWFGARL